MKTAQEIKDLDWKERREYLEKLFESNPDLRYINRNVKLKTGGRKATKISCDDFKTLLIESLWKTSMEHYKKHPCPGRLYALDDINQWGKSDVAFTIMDIIMEDFDEDLIKSSKFKKLGKDLSKIDLYFENAGIDGYSGDKDELEIKVTKSGIPYIIYYVSMDYGCEAYCFIYWDGKDFRGYVPLKGNLIDTKKKILLNQDDPSTARYILDQILPDIPKLYGPDQEEDLMDDFEVIYDVVEPNLDWMIEDFESRLTVI
jgi:hypothetical protein